MKYLITAISLLSLCGCAGMSSEARVSETAYQVLNVVDTGQTITIGRSPNWREGISQPELGARPRAGRTYAVMAIGGLAHFAITRLLDSQDPGHGAWHVASLVWQGVSIAGKGYVVIDNAAGGIGPWGGAVK